MIYDKLENIGNYKGLGKIYDVLKFLAKTDFIKMPLGKYELDGENIYYLVQEYETKEGKGIAEAHRKYIDIQLMVKGEEVIGIAPISSPKKEVEAAPERDAWFYECSLECMTLTDETFMVLYPNDLHMPGVTKDKPTTCRKVVVKIKVD